MRHPARRTLAVAAVLVIAAFLPSRRGERRRFAWRPNAPIAPRPGGSPDLRVSLESGAHPLGEVTTIVSLTFDDGTAGHALARQILDAHGLKGTFYVNSGQIGTSGYYMTLSDLRAIHARGHEIAGHTLNHPDVTTLVDAERRHQICDDRARLVQWGFNPVSFAYPFGAYDSQAQAVVRSCGYKSARTVGGVASCPACRASERLEPRDPFAILTPNSVTNQTTLEDLQRTVTRAEDKGGGWVVLVFHKVCDNCDVKSVSPSVLSEFASWLKGRQELGTYVATVGQVMSGNIAGAPPPPSPPPPTGPPTAGANWNVFPNPWRADAHRGLPITFTGVSPGSTIRLYTLSGKFVRTVLATSGTVAWDLTGETGSPVGAGYFMYIATAWDGQVRKGTVAILR